MPEPPREALIRAKAQAIQWATAILILAAIPCIVWLWRWAL